MKSVPLGSHDIFTDCNKCHKSQGCVANFQIGLSLELSEEKGFQRVARAASLGWNYFLLDNPNHLGDPKIWSKVLLSGFRGNI